MVRDIDANALTDINGTLLFAAHTQPNSFGLWKSDGTSVGTVLIKEITCGTSSCHSGIDDIVIVARNDILQRGY